MRYLTPAHHLLLRRNRPEVKLQDVRSDTTDLTTYTFTDVNIGDLGTAMSVPSGNYANQAVWRSPTNRTIAVMVHSEAAAVTWTVTSCTIGGVAGVKAVDRGGATVAINSAIFLFGASILQGISNTNVVVTMSKAVTSCAIGVISIENISYTRDAGIGTGTGQTATGSAVGTGGTTTSTDNSVVGLGLLSASTHATGLETVQFTVRPDNQSGCQEPYLLYDQSNAEIGFAAAWTYSPNYPSLNVLTSAGGGMNNSRVDWSGSGNFDLVVCSIV